MVGIKIIPEQVANTYLCPNAYNKPCLGFRCMLWTVTTQHPQKDTGYCGLLGVADPMVVPNTPKKAQGH
jgi:hypothetical protein